MTQYPKNLCYRENTLFFEDVPLHTLAQQWGTPLYVYSLSTLRDNYKAYTEGLAAIKHSICYAVKANSNIALLSFLAKAGAGFDIVSQGELERVLTAGASPETITFSGVGKQKSELRRALSLGIHCFNVESLPELERLNILARELGVHAPIALRINPNVDAQTHPYIATGLQEHKFGIPWALAEQTYHYAASLDHISVIGAACHIGSQITSVSPFLEAVDKMLALVDNLSAQGLVFEHLDLGGGLGVSYNSEPSVSISDFSQALSNKLIKQSTPSLLIKLEPGRSLVAEAGILLTQVEYIKSMGEKNFAIVDAAMNDLIRPALYQAWQGVLPITQHEAKPKLYDVVGPICESGDYLAKQRALSIEDHDLLAICHAGAYGFCMSSNYNSRPRAAEVLVHGDKVDLIRERETYASLYAPEHIPK